MKPTYQLMSVTMPRFWQVCAMACAVSVLPMGMADAKPAKKKPEVAERKSAEKKKPQSCEAKKSEAWNRKLKAAVKDGIITDKEARKKLADFKKKLMEEKRAEQKKLAEKKAAAKKAADKKKADQKKAGQKKSVKKPGEKKQPAKKQPAKKKVEKKKPAPMTVREFSQKIRAEVKAGKLTKKEGRAKVADYKKKVGGKEKEQKKTPKADSKKKKK